MAVLQDAIDEIQALMRAVPGVRGAPDEAPDNISQYPFVVTYPSSGTWDVQTPETINGLHNVVIELHVGRRHLPADMENAMPYSDSIPESLFKALRDQTITAIETWDTLSYVFTSLDWGGVDTIGFQYTLNQVKMRKDLT